MGSFHTIWSFGLAPFGPEPYLDEAFGIFFSCLWWCFLYLSCVEKIEAIDDALEDYVREDCVREDEAREDDTDDMEEMVEYEEGGESAREDCV